MSTLRENIERIKAENSTIREKYQKLRIELGLDHENVCNVLEIPYYGSSSRLNDAVNNELRSRRSRRVADTRETIENTNDWLTNLQAAELYTARTFGVEIECLLPYRFDVCSAIRNVNVSIVDNYNNYNHQDSATAYKFMSDASVGGHNCRGGEIVTPILRNLDTLSQVCSVLNANNVKVNKTCGLHVHVSAADLTAEQYINVFKNYQKLERLIDTFMAESRRRFNNRFCNSIVNLDFTNCTNFYDVSRVADTRYVKVNPQAYRRHKTIEFRQHQGSTDIVKIAKWVSFCEKLVEFSKHKVFETEITSIDDIEFLSESEKTFFKARQTYFANR